VTAVIAPNSPGTDLPNGAVQESRAEVEATVAEPQNVIPRHGDPSAGLPNEQWRRSGRPAASLTQLRLDRLRDLTGVHVRR